MRLDRKAPALRSLKRVCRVFQHSTRLLYGDTGEPGDEVRQLRPVFEVLKEGGHWHTSAAEDPGPTSLVRVSINGWASRPIVHAVILDLGEDGFNMETIWIGEAMRLYPSTLPGYTGTRPGGRITFM